MARMLGTAPYCMRQTLAFHLVPCPPSRLWTAQDSMKLSEAQKAAAIEAYGVMMDRIGALAAAPCCARSFDDSTALEAR